MVVFKKAPAVVFFFFLSALMVAQTNAHFTLGRELKLPLKQASVNPMRNVDRRLFVKEQRKPGKENWLEFTYTDSSVRPREFTPSLWEQAPFRLLFFNG